MNNHYLKSLYTATIVREVRNPIYNKTFSNQYIQEPKESVKLTFYSMLQ